jgi:hypothetical protein
LHNVLGFDELGSGGGRRRQSMVSEGIDSAHDSLGGVEESFVGGGSEEGSLEACDLEAVFEVEAGGVSVEAAEGKADGDALSESFEMGQTQDLSQPGLAGEEDGESSGAVPIKVGEKGKEGEDIGPEVMGFVDDEQDGEVAIFDEPLDLVLDEAKGHGARPQRLKSQSERKLSTEIGGVDQRVVQIQSADLVGVEVVAQSPQGGGLAAARLPGEQSDGPGVDEIAQTGVKLFEPRGAKELIGGKGTLEGRMGEAEGRCVEAHSLSAP